MMKKQTVEYIVFKLFLLVTLLVTVISVGIIAYILWNGIFSLNWQFLTDIPRNGMTEGGIFPAIIGTLLLIIGSSVIAFPIGILAGVYMNEYAPKNWFKKFVRMMTNNLAGIPSIVFGLFGMAFFVNGLSLGVSLLSGCLTMAILVLPVVIRTTEESLKTIPLSQREASLALGATRWTTIHKVILPTAFPSILTGLMLSVGRIAGETAPILFTAAAYYLPQLPRGVNDEAMMLSYHLYVISTSGQDIDALRPNADGTALVLLFIVLGLNLLATWLKKRFLKTAKKS